MQPYIKKIIAVSFIVYIFLFFFFSIIVKDRNFSELENRLLTSFPSMSVLSIKEGRFMKNFEEYIGDQFPLRDQFISVKSYSELLLQKKDNNGVFIGKDNYFIQDFKKPDEVQIAKNIEYVNTFAKEFNTYVMIAPTATSILEEKLPAFANPSSELEILEKIETNLASNVKNISLFEALRNKKDEYIYYKTDHHWTTLGAYYAYLQLCESMNLHPLIKSDFIKTKVSENFYGSLFSKGNFTFATPDSIEIYEPKRKKPVDINYVVENKKKNSFYEMSYLDQKDQYKIFLDSNHPYVTIKTGAVNNKKLLVVKDSYANCFVPFLAEHFSEIHVIDPRFINESIKKYAEENKIEDVLILYNVQNFSSSNTLVWLE